MRAGRTPATTVITSALVAVTRIRMRGEFAVANEEFRNRKRVDTDWPEHADRVKSTSERVAEHRARKRAKEAVDWAAAQPEPPEGTEPDPTSESVADAVRLSARSWNRTGDPAYLVALGLAKAFDDCVARGQGSAAATLAAQLLPTLGRLRPSSPSERPEKGADAPPTDPADFVQARAKRLADAAKAKDPGA